MHAPAAGWQLSGPFPNSSHSLWILRSTEFRGRRDAASLSFIPSFTVEDMELKEASPSGRGGSGICSLDPFLSWSQGGAEAAV